MFFDSMGVLCYISEWRPFLIAGVFSAIYLSGGLFLIAGVFSATISEWWLIAGVFSTIYPSGSVF